MGLLFGLVFVIAGLAFKVSAVPFHMWTPDVYEGAPTPITAFFATAPKMAAMGLFARVLHDAFGGVIGDWQQILALLVGVVDVSRGGRRHRSDRYQTPDGLFFDCAYGICADGPCGRHCAWVCRRC